MAFTRSGCSLLALVHVGDALGPRGWAGTDLCLASAPRGRGGLGVAKEPGAVGPRASGPPGVEWAQGSRLSSWAGRGVPAPGMGGWGGSVAL